MRHRPPLRHRLACPRRHTGRIVAAACLVSLAVSGAARATPAASTAGSASVAAQPQTLAEATDRAIALEKRVEEIREDRIAIETRIQVTNERIFRQQEVLLDASHSLDAARECMSLRLVSMYKSTAIEPVSLLLSSDSFSDFLARVALLARVAELDNLTVRDAVVAAAQADYQAATLDDLKSQDVALRSLLDQREASLVAALADQKAVVAKLTAEERKRLAAYRARSAKSRKAWRASSIPIGEAIPTAEAIVEPYFDRTYIVAAYQPSRYRTTNETYSAVCSWYGNEFNGRLTASGQVFNQDDLTCASRTLPFGTRLALTRAGRRIIVVVNDRGPFIAGRDLDLSREAARRLGFSGVETVNVEVVEAIE